MNSKHPDTQASHQESFEVDFLTPEQRLKAVAEVLATITLRANRAKTSESNPVAMKSTPAINGPKV